MNATLPRLDWMLLLHDERPEHFGSCLVVGGDDALVHALELFGGADLVDRSFVPGRLYNLILVVRPDSIDTLRAVVDQLAPGGVLYVETHRSRRLRADEVAAVIESSATQFRGQWVLLPTTQRPRRYLPVNAPRAWRWYLRTLFVATTPALRLQGRVLAAVARFSGILTRIAPGIATLGVRPPDPLCGESGVLAASGEPVPGAAPERLDLRRTVLITSGYDSGSRAVVLPFQRGSRWPDEVVKVARREELRDATRLEHQRLVQLHLDLPAELTPALPTPRGLIELPRSTATRQMTARGPIMLIASGGWPRHRREAQRDLHDVADWLAGLHRATARPLDTGQTAGDLWLLQPLALLPSRVELPDSVVKLVETAAADLDACGPLPTVTQHYDVGPWNIVRVRGAFTLLDWELDHEAGRTGWGPPLVDFIYFSSAWYNLSTRRLDRSQELTGLIEAFDGGGKGWQGEVFTREVAGYFRRTGVPTEAFRPLVVACWLERAVTAQSRWARLQEGTPDLKGLEYLAALAERDFLGSGKVSPVGQRG